MERHWVWAVVISCGAIACKKESTATSAPSASAPSAVATTVPSATATGTAPTDANGCVTDPSYVLSPQKYGDSDLIRALVVDGDQLYFRNMTDVFRMPLAGGTPSALSKGPALLLSGTTVMWTSGDRLVTQSAGEPVFMESPKTGGPWKTFIDLTKEKLGGGRDVATRVMQNIGRGSSGPKATQASLDGRHFYWAEVTHEKGPRGAASSVVKTVPLAGGAARTLYEAPGEIADVHAAGDRVVFLHTAPPSADQLAKQEQDRKAKKISFGARGESRLYSVPAAGGEARALARVKNVIAPTVLGVDGRTVYVSGYLDEDPSKPGIFRADAAGEKPVEKLDDRALGGDAWVSGDSVVFIGQGFVEPGKSTSAQLVLTAPRNGKGVKRVACIGGKYTTHASAVANRSALLALFTTSTHLASIARVPLP